MNKLSKAFTLIELLIVIGIVAILSAVVIIAVNPARQFAQARNTQRISDVVALLNAFHQNMVDNRGSFDFSGCGASSVPASATTIASSGGVDLCGCLAPLYLASLPYDPSSGSYTDCAAYDTGYTIYQDAVIGRITVAAPSAELGETISVTR